MLERAGPTGGSIGELRTNLIIDDQANDERRYSLGSGVYPERDPESEDRKQGVYRQWHILHPLVIFSLRMDSTGYHSLGETS